MRLPSIEKLSTGGALLAALACPVCFPKFALLGAALGFGVLAPFERYTAWAVQGLFVVAWVAQLVAYKRHGNRWLLAFATLVTLTLFAGFYVVPSTILLQSALTGLAIASVWLIVTMRRGIQRAPPLLDEADGSTAPQETLRSPRLSPSSSSSPTAFSNGP